MALGTNASVTANNSMSIGGLTATDRMSVGIGTATPNQNASLDLAETDKGFMITRMTNAEQTTFQGSLTATEEGMTIYNTEDDKLETWDGTQWIEAGVQDLSLTGNTLSLTDDASTVDLSGYLDNTDNQDLSLTGNTLSLTNDGSTVDLSGYLDNTDAQDLSLTGNTLSLTNDGTTVDLSGYLDDTQLTEAQVDAYVANNGYLTSFTEVDGDVTNEIQDLSLTGNTLSLSSDATTVDLSAYLDDTQLTEAQVDAYVANNGYLTSFTEVDGDVTNEIQDLSLTGNDLTITNNGSATTIDLSGYLDNTDAQDLDLSGNTLSLTNDATTVDLSAYLDNTDAQNLTLTGNDLTIDNGNTVDLSAFADNTDEQDLTAATLTGTVLEIEIENGASVSVDLAPLLSSIETQLNDHEIRITEREKCACDSTAGLWDGGLDTEMPILYQNIPNPFNNTSTIKYYIPSYANSANLIVSNEMGQIVSNIELKEVGSYGEAHINAEGLNPGAYYYTLYVNQSKHDTKTMVVQ